MKCPVCDNQMILRWKYSAQEQYCPKCGAIFCKGVWWIGTKKIENDLKKLQAIKRKEGKMANVITQAKIEYTRQHYAYNSASEKLGREIVKVETRLKSLEDEKTNLCHPSWIDLLLKPIAEAMLKHLPNRTFKILGPFGMTNETGVHFYKKGIKEKNKFKGDNCISITFRPAELPDLTVVDYSVDTGQFKPETIGEMNGMNHPSIPIQNDINWLLAFMLKKENKVK